MVKKVVVVGGGMGGLYTAKFLANAKNADVTLISPRDYWDYSISSPRCVVEPEATVKHNFTPSMAKTCAFLKCTFKQGVVTEVADGSVTLADGTVIEADVVVLAIGGSYAGGMIWKARATELTAEARLEGFRAKSVEIAAAQHIVVGGGGLVGQEVAAEIKSKYPDKEVCLVGTIGGCSPKLIKKVTKALKKLKVVLIEDRTLGEPASSLVALKKGDPVKCDLLLTCAGFVYDSSCCEKNFGSAITEKGQLQTEPSLLLKGAKSVFALGDIVEVPRGALNPASGFTKCEAMARIVADGIISPSQKPYAWPTKPSQAHTPCITALGPKTAVADMGMPISGLENFLGKFFKCDSYFMRPKMGAEFGVTYPKKK